MRRERFKKKLSLKNVAARMGLHPSMLSRLEGGKRRVTVEHVERFAAVLDVPPTQIYRSR